MIQLFAILSMCNIQLPKWTYTSRNAAKAGNVMTYNKGKEYQITVIQRVIGYYNITCISNHYQFVH